MGFEGKGGIDDDAEVACTGGGGNSGGADDEGGVIAFGESGLGADEEKFCFLTVELKEVILHPGFDGRQAGVDVGEGRVMGGGGAEVDLGIVGVTVKVQVEVTEDLTKGEDVSDEQNWAEYRTLGDTM